MNLKNLHFGSLKVKFQNIPEQLRSLLSLAILILIVLIFKVCTQEKPKEKPVIVDANIGTVIPAGYVLVPIEISNIDSVSPLLGQMAVVDLFKISEKGKSQRIANHVKVLRAPNNPSIYAALVKDDESDLLMNHPGPYYAAIQNEKVTGARVEKPKPANSKINISYSP